MFPSLKLETVYFNFVHMPLVICSGFNILQYHFLCDLSCPLCLAFHLLLHAIIWLHERVWLLLCCSFPAARIVLINTVCKKLDHKMQCINRTFFSCSKNFHFKCRNYKWSTPHFWLFSIFLQTIKYKIHMNR